MQDPSPSMQPGERPTIGVRELLFEYLERVEADGEEVLDELCERHPKHAAGLRKRVNLLRSSGLVEDEPRDFPERLGHFRLLDCIGGGGMGVVFRALDESLAREVALKLVRPSEMYFPGARDRFRREVEAIARLSHPGIVPVYSVGEEDGIPFFAMERIEGCTLGEVLRCLDGCDPDSLSGADLSRAVAEVTGSDPDDASSSPLFDGTWAEVCARIVREVAEALEHAHRRGVLHRDVKPSNVMITRGGRVMLLDFGLSSAEGVERITRTGSTMGSLPYMSPEQLDGDWKSLDARSDVYALGVSTYELVSLRLPFAEASVGAMRAAVLEGRAAPVRRHNPRASWEMETIIASAMDTDPARRYASASDFGADLGAMLEGRPIRARRTSAWRRTTRWVQRSPARAASVALTAVVVVGGPALYGWQQRAARLLIEDKNRVIEGQKADLFQQNLALEAQRDEARAQEARAEENFEQALAAVDTMLTRVAGDQLADVPGLHGVRRDVLAEARDFYVRFLERRADDDKVRLETARAWRRVGDLHGLLDEDRSAELAQARAISLYEELVVQQPDSPVLWIEMGSARGHLGLALRLQGRVAEAETNMGRGLEDVRMALELEGPNGDDAARSALASISIDLALMLVDASRSADVRALIEPLMPELDERLAAHPDDPLIMRQVARALHALGLAVGGTGATLAQASPGTRASAAEHFRGAIGLFEALVELDPDLSYNRQDLGRTTANLAVLLSASGDYEQARRCFEDALPVCRALVEDYPGVPTYDDDLATARVGLASALLNLGEIDAALDLLRLAAEAFEGLIERDPNQARYHQKLAGAATQEGVALWNLRRDAEGAREALERAVPACRRALEAMPGDAQLQMALEWCLAMRAPALLALGDHAAAADAALELGEIGRGADARVAGASYLAACAQAVEARSDIPEDERYALAGRYDEDVLAILDEAFAAGFDPQEVVRDPDYRPLTMRDPVRLFLEDLGIAP